MSKLTQYTTDYIIHCAESSTLQVTYGIFIDEQPSDMSAEVALLLNSITMGHQNGVPADVVASVLRCDQKLTEIEFTLVHPLANVDCSFDVNPASLHVLVSEFYHFFSYADKVLQRAIDRARREADIAAAADKLIEIAETGEINEQRICEAGLDMDIAMLAAASIIAQHRHPGHTSDAAEVNAIAHVTILMASELGEALGKRRNNFPLTQLLF